MFRKRGIVIGVILVFCMLSLVFAEDLSLYEDAQIGAAVRTIQEDCKKTINKYLAPKAVVDQPEGEEVTIEADFDPSAIKLTGNVTGEPPFKGILRHKGWQATKSDLPELSDSQDSKIISPAEVDPGLVAAPSKVLKERSWT